MMAEYEGDNNHDHFQRTPEFAAEVAERFSQVSPELRQEFLDFLITSVTSEFSGCMLYNEIQKNVSNPDIKALMRFMARDESRHAGFINQSLKDFGLGPGPGRPEAHQGLHLLQAQVHLLRHLPVREDRLRALHHHLPPARAPPRQALPPDLPLVRALVQRRIPPRRKLRADHARQPHLLRGGNVLWIRFFLLAVYATMYVRDHTRPMLHEAMGLDSHRVRLQGVPHHQRDQQAGVPDLAGHRPPGLPRRHGPAVPHPDRMDAAKARGGVLGKLKQAGWAVAGAATFARLYLLPVKHHAAAAGARGAGLVSPQGARRCPNAAHGPASGRAVRGLHLVVQHRHRAAARRLPRTTFRWSHWLSSLLALGPSSGLAHTAR
jgi:magnesium-protoporphyrin IX monomethyl ester (oxidative) cyclase